MEKAALEWAFEVIGLRRRVRWISVREICYGDCSHARQNLLCERKFPVGLVHGLHLAGRTLDLLAFCFLFDG